ncbi:hypothetical protein BCR39DRAFT_514782 [Naematelia encephala]|uniref:ATP synthase F(0) complex subunit e, mitochondrial n=1 Tax=Naematelia encephala TaxID=71784 RepID=A0A1Y2BJL0_9TREE|nr:hypothetical protein BCR39DRAFT_514782 [Naematelia encephala]
MASSVRNVVRYTALLSGIGYGLVHQGTLQTKYDAEKELAAEKRRTHLIEEARKAYLSKIATEKAGSSSGLITDPEDPQFDPEKIAEYYSKES